MGFILDVMTEWSKKLAWHLSRIVYLSLMVAMNMSLWGAFLYGFSFVLDLPLLELGGLATVCGAYFVGAALTALSLMALQQLLMQIEPGLDMVPFLSLSLLFRLTVPIVGGAFFGIPAAPLIAAEILVIVARKLLNLYDYIAEKIHDFFESAPVQKAFDAPIEMNGLMVRGYQRFFAENNATEAEHMEEKLNNPVQYA